MSILTSAILVLGFLANDDHDLDLAAALARRGWVELAEELCTRIDKNPAASATAKAGVPLVLAEVAIAKARREADAVVAAKELDAAVERLNRAGHAPTLDERGMTGWLHVQKSKILSAAAEDDAARRPDAIKAWVATEAFYRLSLAELEKMPTSRAVDEAILETRLELPKAMSSLARVPSVDEALRKKLHEEAIRMFSDFQFNAPQPILLEALLEEARSRADLGDHARAELRFRSMPGVAKDLKKRGFPPSEYVTSLLQSGVLGLVRTLTQAKKTKEAIAACDEFLRDNPRLVRSPIGYAVALSKAEAMYGSGDVPGAIAQAQKVVGFDPEGAAGRTARQRIRKWMTEGTVTPERVMLVADGLLDQGLYREALLELRRCVEVCTTTVERAKYEPVASFKKGECFRALKQDAEAAVAFQEVFRKYPTHELAKRAAFEAVRSLSRVSSATGDRRDEEQMEKLLDEVEKLGLQGESGTYLRFIRAEILERKGQVKAAADLYIQIDETCEVYDDAMVSAGHGYRVDAEQRWEKSRGAASLRDELAKQLGAAEGALKRVVARQNNHKVPSRLLFTAYHELAIITLHELVNRPKDSLGYLEKCTSLLPAESPMLARLRETEILAHLAAKDVESAAAGLEKMMAQAPDSISTLRSCRRVGLRLEATDLSKAAGFYRFWLDHSGGLKLSSGEIQTVADGLYRAARSANGVDEKVLSVMDLKGKPVADRGIWKEAARAHEMLIQAGGLAEKDAVVASSRLAWCAGFSAQTGAEWGKSKLLCEKLVQDHQLLNKDGSINQVVLQNKKWLLGIYLENGHSLYQLGKAGQKFQYTNGLTIFNQILDLTEKGSEPWWIARYLSARCYFERGEGRDIRTADAVISSLQGNYPAFDEGKYGFKDKFLELRDQVRAVLGPQR